MRLTVAAIGRRLGAIGALIVSALPLHAQARPQLTGSLETGAAAIEQPLVRSGAAFYVSPSARLSVRDFTIGSYAVLATGTPIWQSFLGNGFVRTAAFRGTRLVGSGQALKTTGLATTLHGDVGMEWRGGSQNLTSVLRARTGQLRYAESYWRDTDLGASAILSHGAMILALDAGYSDARRPVSLQRQLGIDEGVGDAFTARTLDFTPRMIWERGRLRADASLALRAVQSGLSGTRVGPQVAFTLQSARGLSLFLGGAQRLPDARTGVPSGRSALFGVRVEGRRELARSATKRDPLPALRVESGTLVLETGSVAVARVELRGDFTDWQVRACQPRTARLFDCGKAPVAGTWRVAVRLNEAEWRQPANLAAAADDFGSVDGVLMTGGKP